MTASGEDTAGLPSHPANYEPCDPFTLDGPEAERVLAVMDEWALTFVFGLHVGTRIQLANEFARAATAGRRQCQVVGCDRPSSESNNTICEEHKASLASGRGKRRSTTGGYSSGDKRVSDLAPPPSDLGVGMKSPGKDADAGQ